MTGLLDLPVELLLDIFDLTLFTPPRKVPRDTVRRRCWDETSRDRPICYLDSRTAFEPNALALLLVCRKMHTQLAHYLTKVPRICTMDLAIVNAHWFLPTFQFIPTRDGSQPAILDKYQVNLIPCCTEEDRGFQTDWPAVYWEGRPLTMKYRKRDVTSIMWEFKTFSVIERLLAVGALGKRKENVAFAKSEVETIKDLENPLNLRVRTLIINTSTYPDQALDVPLSLNTIPARKVDTLRYSYHDTLYPIDASNATKMMLHLSSIMEMRLRRGRSSSAKRVLERVGCIKFSVDGLSVMDLDMGDYMYLGHEGDDAKDLEMRKLMVATRRELGL